MKEIVYLNTSHANPPKRDNGKWKVEELDVVLPPTKCKIVINKSIVIPDVYVRCKEGENICLYRDYHIERFGWTCSDQENCWAIFRGDHLVLEFKSDDFVIEAI